MIVRLFTSVGVGFTSPAPASLEGIMKKKIIKRFELRLSERLYKTIKKASEGDRRSMHNEITTSLERLYLPHPQRISKVGNG